MSIISHKYFILVLPLELSILFEFLTIGNVSFSTVLHTTSDFIDTPL